MPGVSPRREVPHNDRHRPLIVSLHAIEVNERSRPCMSRNRVISIQQLDSS